MDHLEQRQYDAVVVGAGNGGMAAACQFAVSGRKVLLLEQQNIIGGFSTSFVRGRFEFEASLHELCEFGPPEDKGILRRMFEDLGVEVDWIPVPEAYRLIVPSEDIDVVLPFGVDEFIDAMEKYVPGSHISVRRFFELSKEANEAMVYVQDLQTRVKKLSKAYMLYHYPNFIRMGTYSVEDVYNAIDMPQKARDILSAYWCYLGVSLDRMDFSLYGYMVYDYIKRKAWIPRYRSTELALAFEKKIIECGGEIECNTRVEKVLVEHGRVKGVRTASGETILARQVICNASPYHLYQHMIEPKTEVPRRALQELTGRKKSISGFVVFLGLDKPPDELGLEDYSYFIYDTSDSVKLYNDLGKPGRPTMQASVCLNSAIPDCSPPGTTIMSMTVLPKPEAWKDATVENYFSMKSRIADMVIEGFENATGISLREHIEEIEIAAPPTYAHYANAYQGLIYGFETCEWDGVVPRVLMMEEDQLIKGLRIASAYGSRADGYSSAMLNGRTMALYALEEMVQNREVRS
jgi:prolycopene isomerase